MGQGVEIVNGQEDTRDHGDPARIDQVEQRDSRRRRQRAKEIEDRAAIIGVVYRLEFLAGKIGRPHERTIGICLGGRRPACHIHRIPSLWQVGRSSKHTRILQPADRPNPGPTPAQPGPTDPSGRWSGPRATTSLGMDWRDSGRSFERQTHGTHPPGTRLRPHKSNHRQGGNRSKPSHLSWGSALLRDTISRF